MLAPYSGYGHKKCCCCHHKKKDDDLLLTLAAIAAAAFFLQMVITMAMARRRRRKRQAGPELEAWEEVEVSENGIIVLDGVTNLVWAGKLTHT